MEQVHQASSKQANHQVLIVLDCGTANPSGMVRGIQYKDLLEKRQDIQVKFISHKSPFLNEVIHFCGRHLALKVFRPVLRKLVNPISRLRRKTILSHAAGSDLVYVIKVPSLPLYQKLAKLPNPKKIIMDLNDGLWLPHHRESGWKDLEKMLELVHSVVCENGYVAEFARKFCPRVFIVPDPPQLEVFDQVRDSMKKRADQVVLGWVGSEGSADTLFSIMDPLEALFDKHPNLHLRIVGANPHRLPRFEKVRFSVKSSYNQEEMVQEVLGMDIGLFPLYAIEDSLVRGTLKAMIYMSGGAAVICQKMGENTKLIQHGVNGLLVSSQQEWFEALDRLVQDMEERHRLAAHALETVRENFSRERCLDKLIQAFQETLKS